MRIPEITVMLLNVADSSKPPVWTPYTPVSATSCDPRPVPKFIRNVPVAEKYCVLPVGHCEALRLSGQKLEIVNTGLTNVAKFEINVIDEKLTDIFQLRTPEDLEIVPVNAAPLILTPGKIVIEPDPLVVAVNV